MSAWSLGAGGEVGPLKLKGEVGALNVKALINEKGTLKISSSGGSAKGEIGFGSSKAWASAEVVKNDMDIPLTNKDPIKNESKDVNFKAEASSGSLTLNNSLELGALDNRVFRITDKEKEVYIIADYFDEELKEKLIDLKE